MNLKTEAGRVELGGNIAEFVIRFFSALEPVIRNHDSDERIDASSARRLFMDYCVEMSSRGWPMVRPEIKAAFGPSLGLLVHAAYELTHEKIDWKAFDELRARRKERAATLEHEDGVKA